MQINSERAAAIDHYIATHPDSEIARWNIEIAGVKNTLPYFRLPVKLLRYNVQNGRLAMEVREWERDNTRKLDPNVPEDSDIIFEMLINLEPAKTNTLEEDIQKVGQMEPGVITFDGYVINGNRRMAVIRKLYTEHSLPKWEYLEVVRLPKSVDEKDLWRIEAGLQLSKDKIAEYHPVNELLKIKEGVDSGLSPADIAVALYGRTEPEINDSLKRLELIDEFLEFCGQKGNYGFIKKFGLHEYFIDIQKQIQSSWEKRGISKKDRMNELFETFAIIQASIKIQNNNRKAKGKRSSITHMDIRELSKVFSDSTASSAFSQNLGITNNKPIEPKKMLAINPETLINAYQDAREILRNREDRDKPAVLIERAIKALESIDKNSLKSSENRVLNGLTKLSVLVNELNTEFSKNKVNPK